MSNPPLIVFDPPLRCPRCLSVVSVEPRPTRGPNVALEWQCPKCEPCALCGDTGYAENSYEDCPACSSTDTP